jgi:hypothetical protein
VSLVAHLRLRALLGTAQSFTGEGKKGRRREEKVGGRREYEESEGEQEKRIAGMRKVLGR